MMHNVLNTNEAGWSQPFLTLKEAAHYLNISTSTMYKLKASGALAYSKPRGKIYFSKEELDRYILSFRVPSISKIRAEFNDSLTKTLKP